MKPSITDAGRQPAWAARIRYRLALLVLACCLSLVRPAAAQELYTVQAGAFTRGANAERLLGELQRLGFPAELHAPREPGSGLLRVMVGTFTDRQAAGRMQARLAGAGIDGFVTLDPTTLHQGGQPAAGAAAPFMVIQAGPADYSHYRDTVIENEDARTATDLARRPDDRRPPDQYRTRVFGRPLTIGGEYEIEAGYRQDYAFDTQGDDLLRIDQRLELEFLYGWSPDVSLFLEGKAEYRNDAYVEDRPDDETGHLLRGETWLHIDHLLGGDWGLQVGRQNFREKRRWWWDENLDALRLYYNGDAWRAELAVAEELARVSTSDEDVDPEKDDIRRILGHASWRWAKKNRLEFFFLRHRDHSATPFEGEVFPEESEDEVDADLTWYGLRAQGLVKHGDLGRFYYWGDIAYVQGDEAVIDFDDISPGLVEVDDIERFDVAGWAADIGLTWATRWPARPRFTLSYAYGSGDDDSDDGTDHGFRQTGLNDNKGKYSGVDSFRYYGEVLRPELSNLEIATAALGFPLMTNSSIELLFHRYRQVHAAPRLRRSRLRIRPLGEDRHIGTELDFVIGLEEWKHLELELVAGLFRAGNAFGEHTGKYARTAIFTINYNF